MLKLEKKHSWIVGLSVFVISAILMFVGMKFLADIEPGFENYIAYIIFSLIVGGLAAILNHFRLKIAMVLYMAGLLIGFFLMYRAFLYDMSGWGDLIGVMSMLIWTISGLIAGLLAQLTYYIYKKIKKK